MSTRDIEGESKQSMAKTFVTSLTKCWKHANRSKEAEDRTAEADRRLDRYLEKLGEHDAHGYV